MSTTIDDGGQVTKDPADIRTYIVDWDARHLATSVTIVTSVWTITAIRPSADTALTKDQDSILAGTRKTQIRLSAGTLGAIYQVTNTIVTNETPAQTIERSFRVLVQNK